MKRNDYVDGSTICDIKVNEELSIMAIDMELERAETKLYGEVSRRNASIQEIKNLLCDENIPVIGIIDLGKFPETATRYGYELMAVK